VVDLAEALFGKYKCYLKIKAHSTQNSCFPFRLLVAIIGEYGSNEDMVLRASYITMRVNV
jgi:hypothetical protein